MSSSSWRFRTGDIAIASASQPLVTFYTASPRHLQGICDLTTMYSNTCSQTGRLLVVFCVFAPASQAAPKTSPARLRRRTVSRKHLDPARNSPQHFFSNHFPRIVGGGDVSHCAP